MIAILTEKPSVAKDIAQALNIDTRLEKEGYYQGRGYMITCALGHLVSLSLPEDYGKSRFTKADLPFIPNPFTLTVRKKKTAKGMVTDKSASRQLEIIRKVFDKCESIIVATDAGREGELIFRFINSYLGCKKPFKRLWISSMTNAAIREGFQNLRKGSDYDNLYAAADCRAKADYLIGINASRALGIVTGIVNNSLGRVQTPTLAMICKRYLGHKKFVSTDFYEHRITLEKDGLSRNFTAIDTCEDKQEAEKIYEHLKTCKTAQIVKVEKQTRMQQAPLLYDLTALQKDANNRYHFPAGKTLEIVQKIYESKLVSYPRTGSRYIPGDVFETIPKIIKAAAEYCKRTDCLTMLDWENLNRHSVDDSKITDHHALIPTGIYPGYLPQDEKTVYEMIVSRTLEAFAPACEKEFTRVEAICDDHTFESRKSRILFSGWRSILSSENDREEDEAGEKDAFPEFTEKENVRISGWNLATRKTSPKPLYTEASLLSAMENAGNQLEDTEQREALKGCGLGTPATRAVIIETLLTRDYMKRSGRNLVPTEKGQMVYNCVKTMRIADVELTGSWEKMLSDISRGEQDAKTFMQMIEIYTEQVTEEILALNLKHFNPGQKKKES